MDRVKHLDAPYLSSRTHDVVMTRLDAVMDYFRKHGVNPLGGCLPMLVQLPMFIALFGMLRGAFELRHERFLWIPP